MLWGPIQRTIRPQEGMSGKLMSVIWAARGYRHRTTVLMTALFVLGGLGMSLTWRHAPSNASPSEVTKNL